MTGYEVAEEVVTVVMRFDPYRDMDRLAQQLAGRVQESASSMAMDAYRRHDEVVVHFDVPGVDPRSIEVTAEHNTLTVRAERRWESEPDDLLIARERPQGMFVRQLMLGEELDTEKIDAAYEAGVLTLKIPVAPAAKPRKIEVRASAPDHSQAVDVEAEGTSDGR